MRIKRDRRAPRWVCLFESLQIRQKVVNLVRIELEGGYGRMAG